MANRVELPVGLDTWALTVRSEALLGLPAGSAGPAADPRALMRAALENPIGLKAPLRRALTPEDRVAVVVDPYLPRLGELAAGLLEHLGSAGISAGSVTFIGPPGAPNDWVADLPDEYADAQLECHDPSDRKKLAYLATTKAGRRVYLNRTLVDADFTVVLTGRGYDPIRGYAGAETAIFPALSDSETRSATAGSFSPHGPAATPTPTRAEAGEVVWLLGTPLLIQVIEGNGDTTAEVLAGLAESTSEGTRRQDARWRVRLTERPDLVIAAVAGDPARTRFATLAAALAAAARVVEPGGRIVLLTAAAPELPEAAERIRRADDPLAVGKAFLKQPMPDAAGLLWAFAAGRASLFIASDWPDELTEELFATPIASAAEVQRLIDAATKVLVLPDADKTMAEIDT